MSSSGQPARPGFWKDRSAAQKVIEIDPTIERWALMKAELEYRYQRLMGGTILT
jgi:ATP-dependent DNA helicase RecG